MLKNKLHEQGFKYRQPINLVSDNEAAVDIASNILFHERTKHIKVDSHYVREKLPIKVTEIGRSVSRFAYQRSSAYSSNLVFHETTRHVKAYFFREKLLKKVIKID